MEKFFILSSRLLRKCKDLMHVDIFWGGFVADMKKADALTSAFCFALAGNGVAGYSDAAFCFCSGSGVS